MDALTAELCGVTERAQIPAALQRYYRRRLLRSAAVQGMSRLSSDIIISQFSTPFHLGEFLKQGWSYKYLTWPSLMTWNMQRFLPMLFYMQFGYLYSYAPSAFEQQRIKQLVRRSLLRNEVEATQVYKHLNEDSVTYFSAKTMAFMRYDRATGEVSKIADAGDFRRSVGTLGSQQVL